ncbi:MAG: hypothetical protein L0Z70_10720 [Chloroflexi bacterium]|nr:hypothetical protein [Chloroflexota bacterium]
MRGRIDGLYASREPVVIEEIKTTTLSLELIDEQHNHLHWAQAQCYAYMFASQHQLSGVSVHLTYFHLDSQQEKTFERHFSLDELQTFFRDLITPYLDWFRKLLVWQARRGLIPIWFAIGLIERQQAKDKRSVIFQVGSVSRPAISPGS